jgi:hypothetical protein
MKVPSVVVSCVVGLPARHTFAQIVWLDDAGGLEASAQARW